MASREKEILKEFLSSFPEIKAEEVEELSEIMPVKAFAKEAVIVQSGVQCQLCYFVLKGCLRQFILNEEAEEKTIALYTEGQAINFYDSRNLGQLTSSTLQCLEDAVLLVGDPEADVSLYAKYPVLMDVTRQMLEAELHLAQNTHARFVSASPMDRYINFLKDRPGLALRVPQYQLASYLGMTPESLSRIKRRIAQAERG
ncbi:MAG: Crp/Fnr family transcriptional regulator [Bacteroidetes bacterium]|nr:MAG: Crp/Fnr family transcriptional regulator [Bacteroidota bacterium]